MSITNDPAKLAVLAKIMQVSIHHIIIIYPTCLQVPVKELSEALIHTSTETRGRVDEYYTIPYHTIPYHTTP